MGPLTYSLGTHPRGDAESHPKQESRHDELPLRQQQREKGE